MALARRVFDFKIPGPLVPMFLVGLGLVASLAMIRAQDGGWGGPGHAPQIVESRKIEIGGGVVQVDFAAGKLDLAADAVVRHVRMAAEAVAAFYGRLPVSPTRVLIVPVPGRGGIVQGTTWGDMHGMPAFTRFRLGEHATAEDLAGDWMMTHELVHTAFPSLPDGEEWMEEGLSTYIEPLARVATGDLTARSVWRDMLRDMPKGEPQPGDEGLDHTHTWARTYWGGALFCLSADVEIHKQTGNRKGLRDALRAIVESGGTIDHDWDLPRALAVGDRATGTHVLVSQYTAWKDAPVKVDLEKLWSELGVRATADGVEFVRDAPLAKVRQAIMEKTVADTAR